MHSGQRRAIVRPLAVIQPHTWTKTKITLKTAQILLAIKSFKSISLEEYTLEMIIVIGDQVE